MKKIDDDKYENTCNVLNLLCIPYIGVYSDNYTFGFPLDVRKKYSLMLPEILTMRITDEIISQDVEMEYFVVTFDLSYIQEKFFSNVKSYLRLNMVPHPYIFYNLNELTKTHDTYIFSSIFTLDELGNNAIADTFEEDGLRINPTQLISKDNRKDIILHSSNDNRPAISPNNCAFLMNFNCKITSFFLTVAVTYQNKIVKFLVAQINIVTLPSSSYLLSPLNEKLFSSPLVEIGMYKEFYKYLLQKAYGFFSYKIVEGTMNSKELIRMVFKILFSDNEYYYMDLCKFVESNFFSLPNIGEEILLHSGTSLYTVEILCKYFTWHVSLVNKFFDAYGEISLSNEDALVRYKYLLEIIKNEICISTKEDLQTFDLKSDSFIDNYFMKELNPQKEKLQIIMNEALNQNLQMVIDLTKKLPQAYRHLIYYKVWERKGKLVGIHQDFGRLSYMNSPELPSCYHTNQEEIVEVLLDVINMIEVFDAL